jgi:2-polyprenyl-3-methyl-5-hydroxy-6-metoxy-1,4-benzoquinol methylase
MQKGQGGHIVPSENKSYNERLFKGGVRKYFHEARFFWLRKKLRKLSVDHGSVVELGCHDGKLLKYLPFKPVYYAGYDANWEAGIDIAKIEWRDYPEYRFLHCNEPADFNPNKEKYTVAVCMETIEHIPLRVVSDYLSRLKSAVTGYLFITVPNEKGLVFLLKYGVKKLFLKVDEPYSWKELYFAATGDLSKVKRNEYGHKGFDYQALFPLISEHFEMMSVESIPFSFLPAWMNFSIGITMRPK